MRFVRLFDSYQRCLSRVFDAFQCGLFVCSKRINAALFEGLVGDDDKKGLLAGCTGI